MKRILAISSLLLISGVIVVLTFGFCNAKSENDTKTIADVSDAAGLKDVKVYYFHGTRRCATCKAVETVTKEALKEYYGDKVTLTSINREEDKENPLIKKYKVSGQTLIVTNGKKKVDLTQTAFLYARTKPEKLKSKIKSTIDSMK